MEIIYSKYTDTLLVNIEVDTNMHINHLHVQAQLLAEMDEEFGISNLVEEEFGSVSRPRQPVRNLMIITLCIFYNYYPML